MRIFFVTLTAALACFYSVGTGTASAAPSVTTPVAADWIARNAATVFYAVIGHEDRLTSFLPMYSSCTFEMRAEAPASQDITLILTGSFSTTVATLGGNGSQVVLQSTSGQTMRLRLVGRISHDNTEGYIPLYARDPNLASQWAQMWNVISAGCGAPFSAAPLVQPTPVTKSPPAAASVNCASEGTLRSLRYDTRINVKIRNNTNRALVLYWLNYQGKREAYGVLQPGTETVQATFVTHPWLLATSGGKCVWLFVADAEHQTVVVS